MPEPFKLREYDLEDPEKIDGLLEKFEGLEKEYELLLERIDTLSDDDAYEFALYMESWIKVGMDPAMIADLLDYYLKLNKK
jgi:hypothetical protein